MKKKILVLFLLIPSFSFSDDIWFLFPRDGQPVTGKLTIQLQAMHPENITISIIHDHTDQLVWRGLALYENDHKITVDTSRFKPGKYEINAEYYLEGKTFDGDIDIWVNK